MDVSSSKARETVLSIRKRPVKTARLYYLDWARVFAFSLLIVYHTGLIFAIWPWHIKSEVRSDVLEHLVYFITQWRIPLLVFISGAGTGLAYKGNYFPFLTGRFKRLLIPLVVGILLILPLQFLLERYWQGVTLNAVWKNPFGFFLGYYPKGNFSLYHLWYLWDLWKVSVVGVPVLYLIDKHIKNQIAAPVFRIGLVSVSIGAMVVLKALPALDLVEFAVVFGLGFLVFRNIHLFSFSYPLAGFGISGVCYFLLLAYFWKYGYASMPPHIGHLHILKWVFRLLVILNSAGMVYAIICLFKRYCNYRHPLIVKLNRIIVPVYILHQLAIMGLGMVFLKTDFPPVLTFLLIQVVFWPLILAICNVLLARLRFTRAMFGIRELTP